MKKTILIALLLTMASVTESVTAALILLENSSQQHGEYIQTHIISAKNHEDKYKTWIAGELINILSIELKNNTKLEIDIDHQYNNLRFLHTKYCIGYTDDKLIIKSICFRVIPLELVKLAEYALTHKKEIVKNQKLTKVYYHNHYQPTYQSIDSSKIIEILDRPASPRITALLKNKIYRPEQSNMNPHIKNEYAEHGHNATYYFQNNKYHIIHREGYSPQTITELAEFDDIFQFSVVYDHHIMLFDTDSSFYFYDYRAINPYVPKSSISQRHIFTKRSTTYAPYTVIPLGGDRICVTMYHAPKRKFKLYYDDPEPSYTLATGHLLYNMIYLVNNDFLLEDADDIIDSIATRRIMADPTRRHTAPGNRFPQ